MRSDKATSKDSGTLLSKFMGGYTEQSGAATLQLPAAEATCGPLSTRPTNRCSGCIIREPTSPRIHHRSRLTRSLAMLTASLHCGRCRTPTLTSNPAMSAVRATYSWQMAIQSTVRRRSCRSGVNLAAFGTQMKLWIGDCSATTIQRPEQEAVHLQVQRSRNCTVAAHGKE